MTLSISLPFQIFLEPTEVLRVVVETPAGAVGLLPRRLDCVAALTPGILTYQTRDQATCYVAVDEGVMVKIGAEVLVSVRHAIGGRDLGQLQDAVKPEFVTLREDEKTVRAALAKLEGGFIRQIAEFNHGK